MGSSSVRRDARKRRRRFRRPGCERERVLCRNRRHPWAGGVFYARRAGRKRDSGRLFMFFRRVAENPCRTGNRARVGQSGGRTGMALWLFKQEPTCYSFADLQRDGSTVWDGVSNALAAKELASGQARRPRILLPHRQGKGRGRRDAGRGDAREAPTADDPEAVVVEVEAVRQLARPVTLAEIKADPLLQRLGPGAAAAAFGDAGDGSQWRRIEELARRKDDARRRGQSAGGRFARPV